jgi:hypothetical protein
LRAEVRRRGEVVILRFRREEHRPPRKPSAKRFFRGVKAALAPCQEPEITADQLEDLILKTFGSNYQYHILISDEKFRTISAEAMRKLLAEDDTDTLPYIETYSDCDDYSDVLLGQLTRKTWTQGFALGQLWYINEQKGFGHAVNLFCDGTKIWVVEPQSDLIVEWGTGDYSGKAFMIKF